MENVNHENTQPVQPLPQTPLIIPKSTNWAKFLLFIALGLVIIVGSVFAGIQIGKKQTTNSQPIALQPTPHPTQAIISPKAIPTEISPTTSLPAGWIYKSDACNVRFPIPPKEVPYFQVANPNSQPSVTSEEGSGRFWDFPRGGTYPNLLSKLYTTKVNLESKQAIATYASTDEASGYVSQAVSVSCIKNDQLKIVDNEEMLSLLSGEIDKYNNQAGEKVLLT